jgi:hypothetical protein
LVILQVGSLIGLAAMAHRRFVASVTARREQTTDAPFAEPSEADSARSPQRPRTFGRFTMPL